LPIIRHFINSDVQKLKPCT